MHDYDLISVLQGGESMGDHQNRATSKGLADVRHHLLFGVGIKGAGGFIKNHHLRILEQHSGQGDALPLPA